MPRYEFELRITPEEYLDYYRGVLKGVVARSTGGQTVQFPASLLQAHLLPDGIHGRFALTCDDQFRNSKLERLPSP
ncbi:MAG: DUF2835 domain-containing protein [Verrucomicrobiota bacterium]